jgi:hypothetical protein
VTISTEKGRYLSPRARTIVLNSLHHFLNRCYELFAACVMPDPAHLSLQPWPKDNDDNGNGLFWPLSELMHSIKSFRRTELTSLRVKGDPFGRRNSSIEMCGRIPICKRNFTISCAIRGIQGWQSRIKIPWVWTQDDERRKESLFRRDAETSTRDACATQKREP